MAARFLLTTFGSLGDLHPYIAVGLGLRARGHSVTIGSSENYRAKVEGEGLGFARLAPDLMPEQDSEAMRRAMHPRTGTEYVFRKIVLPRLRETYEATLEAARDADLLVGHGIAFATPTVAELLRKRWISIALQPSVFLSAYDPPAISGAPLLTTLHGAGPGLWRPLLRLARRVVRRWGAPVNALRRELGLPALRNPVLDDMFSASGTQAWFSKILAKPQPDWPAKTVVTGFPFYDKQAPGQGISRELARFLDAGPAPVVFTLGSSAVLDAGTFYAESLEAVRRMGVRAVLLTGRDLRNQPADPIPETVFVAEYAPYSELLARGAATVHQGGVGTTAQALRAGRPMVVVPWSHDQPDNGMRVARLGAGRVLGRSKYRAESIAAELKTVLTDDRYARAAAAASVEMATENGVRAACDGLEAALAY